MGMTAPAVLFDIDGTLIDSNYLHVHAWQRAFSEENMDVEAWRIHRLIGMDGSELVDTLVPDASDDAADRLKELNSRFYMELIGLLKPLPGALRLLDAWQVRHGDMPRAPTAGLHGYRWPDKPDCYDYFFVTDDLAPRVADIWVQSETSASDHQPVLVELD